MVLAPSSGESRQKGLARRTPKEISAAGLIAEAGGDETGMQAIGGDAGACKPPRQFAGEEDVAELGLGVDGKALIGAAALQIVKIQMSRGDARPMRSRPRARPLSALAATDW